MQRIRQVNQVTAHVLKLPAPLDELLAITATGDVPTTGWTALRLAPRYYVIDPPDHIWDFDFIGDEPTGIVGEVVLPVSAHLITHYPHWCRGVRVHSSTNSVEAMFAPLKAVARSPSKGAGRPKLAQGHVIVRQIIASFDDSIQPTGRTRFDPWPHIEMKKLHHELELIVEGPDEAKIRDCIQKAIAAGLIAAILAAFITGGAALPAAISTFLAELHRCLGNGFSARVENHSHWIYWWT